MEAQNAELKKVTNVAASVYGQALLGGAAPLGAVAFTHVRCAAFGSVLYGSVWPTLEAKGVGEPKQKGIALDLNAAAVQWPLEHHGAAVELGGTLWVARGVGWGLRGARGFFLWVRLPLYQVQCPSFCWIQAKWRNWCPGNSEWDSLSVHKHSLLEVRKQGG